MRQAIVGHTIKPRLMKILAAGAVLAFATAAGLTGASPAAAHTSTYCGHGSNGIWDVTHYLHYHGNPQGQSGHLHHYFHDMRTASDHENSRYC